MQSLIDIADPIPPVDSRALGAAVYDRFASSLDTFAIAVVDAENRPVGLVERNAFSLKMASEYGRALYARRAITLLMQDDPLVVEGGRSVSAFTAETLKARADDVTGGFIIVQDGRYAGVSNSLALLKATSAANRVQAEAMTEMASSFRLLFENNPVAMFVVDKETTLITAANEAALAQYGYSLEQLSRMRPIDIMAPEERERYVEQRPVFTAGPYIDSDGWRHMRADGSSLFVEGYIRPTTHAGRPAYLCALFDITKRKETEAQISQTRAFLDTVVEAIPQTLLVRDAVTEKLILINRAGEELLGVSRQDVLGASNEHLIPIERAAFRARRDQAFQSGRLHTDEETITTRHHGDRCLEIKRIAVQGAAGRKPFHLSICEDITERKRDAGALRHARDAAEASNRAKSEFLANMSHEIRTPLNGVVGVADALARTRLDPAQTEMVQIVQSSAVALDRLLSDVLDLARVESGRLSITPEPLDLGDLVHQAAALFRSGAHAKGLTFDVSLAPDACAHVEGDGVRIKQILFNLLSNAIKFTAAGRVALDVRTEDGRFVFEVTDTGVGFAPSAKDAVFGRFQQADGSITRRYGGSGLGLAISRDLAELMGGELDAQAELGHGAVFRLTLPLRRITGAAPAPAPVQQPQPTPGALKILLADDHPTNRKVVELLLGAADVELVSVENGAEAVAAFKTERFDIVLMDLQMPIMDGLTAIALIRQYEVAHGLRTPILALSANALPEHVAASRAAGADGHLAKPITAAALFAGLDHALAGPEAIEHAA
ncbi:MAG: PAS domain S-box protein [Caulobacteraceae bacterium]